MKEVKDNENKKKNVSYSYNSTGKKNHVDNLPVDLEALNEQYLILYAILNNIFNSVFESIECYED